VTRWRALQPWQRTALRVWVGLAGYSVAALTVARRLGRTFDQRVWSER
jgi:hypothetical protein